MKFVDVKSFGIHCRVLFAYSDTHVSLHWSDFIYMQSEKDEWELCKEMEIHQDEGKVINSTVTMTESIQSEMKISSTSPQQHMSLPTRIQPSRSS